MERFFRTVKRLLKNPIYLRYYIDQSVCFLKMIFATIYTALNRKHLYSRDIWLVSDKGTEARDNGYHFFRYVIYNHPELNCNFVITRNSPDANKINDSDKIIIPNSIKHYIYSLSAKAIISSQAFGAMSQTAYQLSKRMKRIHRKDQITVFLQHGIVKDELPHVMDYCNTKYDLFCCTSERERAFLLKSLGYPSDRILALGLCRFDKLIKQHEVKKQILIMPTHRMWIHAAVSGKQATMKEMSFFEESEFYLTYSHLLDSKTLLAYAREKGYRIVFYPHYALQPFIQCFSKYNNDTVIIADKEHYDVQELLIESALLITDYSSVFFDFAYMYKPEIFFQFDEKQFHSEHFKKGYFNYNSDGFGPVFAKENDVVYEVKRIIGNNCKMDEKYKKRVDAFFEIRDANNCKRTFDVICRKANEK